ncbi:DNA topoisomerase 2 [Allomyces javanicus]|nr:DNA topoisomerase 2 [Allomyces javanicus]
MHPTEQVYTPSLVFGSLRTSSNFDDTQQRSTVGVHGIGSKATNIFSTVFQVEIYDSESRQRFQQTWENNMSTTSNPKVVQLKTQKRDYIHITFKPDYEKFGYDGLDEMTFKAMERRVYDVAATLSGIKVFFNGERLKISGFKDYVGLFCDDFCYKQFNEHWHVAVALNGDGNGLKHVSFVNNSLTRLGGYHIDHVANTLATELINAIKKKKKTSLLKPAQIKNQLMLFVSCTIFNPTFNSQTKETMTKRPDKWGTVFEMDSGFMKKVVDSSIFEGIMDLFSKQEEKVLSKTDGAKKSTINVEKLEDANWAGTRKSSECILFLTEGDSAKGFAVKGITSIEGGRNKFGVYPLRGKVLNVREKIENAAAIAGNVELSNIKKILGLEHKRDYSSGTSSLRYGGVAILTDADVDGDHIKGLIINYFDSQFPSLLGNNRNFLMEFITPIIRCKKGSETVSFYSIPEFDQWVHQTSGGSGRIPSGWNVKYYKGLATSQTHEIKEYFRNIATNLKPFLPTDTADREKIDIVFNKKRVNERKEWLKTYNPDVYRDQMLREHKINDFFDQGMIHFSISDNIRSIPSVVDGLKVAQRKILWTMMKKNMVGEAREIKVAQLAADVANFTHYHHGEQRTIQQDEFDGQKWNIRGTFERIPGGIRITELPLSWSGPYKEFLMSLQSEKKWVKSFKNMCTETDVRFDVELLEPSMGDDDIVQKFKLLSSIRTSNMVLFDSDGCLKQYPTATDIFADFFTNRHEILENKVRFLKGVIGGQYSLNQCQMDEIESQLKADGFSDTAELLRMPLSMMTLTKFQQLSVTC